MKNLALEFINTQYYLNNKPFVEKLREEQWTICFSRKYNFSRSLFRDIDRLIYLRTIFHSVLKNAIKEQKISEDFIDELNEYLSKIQIRQKGILENNQINLIYLPKIKETDLLYHIIINSFIDLMNHINTDRLKICQNEECSWIFYDESKNKSRKWCSNKCASLIKVRNHRNKTKKQD